MKKRISFALVAVLPTGCSVQDPRDDRAVVVVEGSRAAGNPAVLPRTAATATSMPAQPVVGPVPPPASARGLGTPMSVRGDFTEKPLPPELAHLNGLGVRSSTPAAPSNKESIP